MKHRNNLSTLLAALALCSIPLLARATVFTPQFTSFGSLPAATFNGVGIPNNSVAITQVGNLTLGLTATMRLNNPALTNNGAGTFFAGTGGDVLNGKPGYGIWNFDYYVAGLGAGQTVSLYFDTNPAVGNNVTTSLPFGNFNSQDSYNLGFSFLGGASFNPNVSGEYSFALVVLNAAGTEFARTAINVNVGGIGAVGVPDAANTAGLLGGAFLVLGHFGRKRRSSRTA